MIFNQFCRFGCYRILISMFMISGVLLISRPSAIFGPDSIPTTVAINAASSTPKMLLPDEVKNGQHKFVSFPPVNTSNNSINIGEEETARWFFWGPISLMGSFHQTFQQHLDHHGKHLPTTPEITVGYVACTAVPFLSALISLITRQCNNKKVPVYILMFWFGIGASCIIIAGKLISYTIDELRARIQWYLSCTLYLFS